MNFFSVNLVGCERALLIPLEKSRFNYEHIWAMIKGKLNHDSEEALIGSIVDECLQQNLEIFKLTQAGDVVSIQKLTNVEEGPELNAIL
jgi:hypothetical protein